MTYVGAGLMPAPLLLFLMYLVVKEIQHYRTLLVKKKACFYPVYSAGTGFLVIFLLLIMGTFLMLLFLRILMGPLLLVFLIFLCGILVVIIVSRIHKNGDMILCMGVDSQLKFVILAILDKQSISYTHTLCIKLPTLQGSIEVKFDPNIDRNGTAIIHFRSIEATMKKTIIKSLDHYYAEKNPSFFRKVALNSIREIFLNLMLILIVYGFIVFVLHPLLFG
jgi:hypothetical protein